MNDDFIRRNQAQLLEHLTQLSKSEEDELQHAKKSARLIKKTLAKIHDYIKKNSFASTEEEINYFKQIKTNIAAHLIYYSEIERILLEYPVGRKIIRKKYLLSEIKRIEKFFNENKIYYRYYRAQSTESDTLYFTRHFKYTKGTALNLMQIDSDPQITTGYDHIFAQIRANIRLVDYLQEKIEILDPRFIAQQPVKQLNCNLNKIDLAELAYALYLTKRIDGTLHQIALALSRIFNKDISRNISRYVDEIHSRKRANTFIDDLHDEFKQNL